MNVESSIIIEVVCDTSCANNGWTLSQTQPSETQSDVMSIVIHKWNQNKYVGHESIQAQPRETQNVTVANRPAHLICRWDTIFSMCGLPQLAWQGDNEDIGEI